jgi:ankyrin repeat protein
MRSTVAASIDQDFEDHAVNRNDANESLFHAVHVRNVDAMRAALDAGAEVNALNKNPSPNSPPAPRASHGLACEVSAVDKSAATKRLFSAITVGGVAIAHAREALDAGADPNARNMFGETPLMAAAEDGQTETVCLLLNRGADVAAVDENGCDALVYAKAHGRTKTALALALALRATQEARDLAAALPPVRREHPRDEADDFGVPDPQPVRPNRPRL